ncbi:MAG: tRNA (adenosine(37)-N6)-threonylcarbamoyltransferase complex transferase subunit TsaD, partial [Cetobacterium sp.]
MIILGIETSCDETSIAVLKDGKEVLSNNISSQIDIHKEYGGVVPEIASRHHIKNIATILEESLEEAKITMDDVDYIAVTYAPGLIGALLVGISFAKGLSYGHDIPLIPVHHIKAHIYGNFIEHDVELPCIALVVSGGHTNIIYIDEEHNFINLGATLDDAVGESYDKVARVMGIGYPGGPIVDKLSYKGDKNA